MLTILIVVLSYGSIVYANAGPVRIDEGQVLHAVPIRSENVHIKSENLIFTVERYFAHVFVEYYIYNESEQPQNLSIVFPRSNSKKIEEQVGEDFKGEYVKFDGIDVEWSFVTVPDEYLSGKEYQELEFQEILTYLTQVMEGKERDGFVQEQGILDVMVFDILVMPKTAHKLDIGYYQMPSMDRTFTRDYTRSYTYYLHPAKYWASFKDLQIKIDLPPNYYLVGSNFDFKEAESGIYEYQTSSLPEADLEFRVYHQPLFLGKFDKIYIIQFAVIAVLILGIVFRRHIKNKGKAA